MTGSAWAGLFILLAMCALPLLNPGRYRRKVSGNGATRCTPKVQPPKARTVNMSGPAWEQDVVWGEVFDDDEEGMDL